MASVKFTQSKSTTEHYRRQRVHVFAIVDFFFICLSVCLLTISHKTTDWIFTKSYHEMYFGQGSHR